MALCSYSKPLILGFGVLGIGTLVTQQQDPGLYSKEAQCVQAGGRGRGVGARAGGVAMGKRKGNNPPSKGKGVLSLSSRVRMYSVTENKHCVHRQRMNIHSELGRKMCVP